MLESFKHNIRSSKIKSASLDLDDLSKLFSIIQELNEESKTHQTQHTNDLWEKEKDRFSEEDVKKINESFLEKYVVGIEIWDSKGRYIRSFEPSEIFDKIKFPENVQRIRITNTMLFESQNQLIQPYRIIVEYDFGSSKFFDLTSNPDHETFNTSKYEVWGIKESWTDGAYDKIDSFIKKRENNRSWIHRKNIYGLLLWLLIVPIILWNLQKVDLYLSSKISNVSQVYYIVIFLYLFFIGLIIFNFLFKYFRNLFPPVELNINLSNKFKVFRTIVISLFSAIILEEVIRLFYNIISFLLS